MSHWVDTSLLPAVVVREKLLTPPSVNIAEEVLVGSGITNAATVYRKGHGVLEERELLHHLPTVNPHQVDLDHLSATGGGHHLHTRCLVRVRRLAHLKQRHVLNFLQSWNGSRENMLSAVMLRSQRTSRWLKRGTVLS